MQKTMLAAVYHGLGDLRLEERPVPVLKEPGDAIVKVTPFDDLHQRPAHLERSGPAGRTGNSVWA